AAVSRRSRKRRRKAEQGHREGDGKAIHFHGKVLTVGKVDRARLRGWLMASPAAPLPGCKPCGAPGGIPSHELLYIVHEPETIDVIAVFQRTRHPGSSQATGQASASNEISEPAPC